MSDLKIIDGDFQLDARGFPRVVEGQDLLLQNAELCLGILKGSFLYDRTVGSSLADTTQEHWEKEVLARANEALLQMPGVLALKATLSGEKIIFELETPQGIGTVRVMFHKNPVDKVGGKAWKK